jgi:putative transposase
MVKNCPHIAPNCFNYYNDERKHTSLDKLTPNEAYFQGREKLKLAT